MSDRETRLRERIDRLSDQIESLEAAATKRESVIEFLRSELKAAQAQIKRAEKAATVKPSAHPLTEAVEAGALVVVPGESLDEQIRVFSEWKYGDV